MNVNFSGYSIHVKLVSRVIECVHCVAPELKTAHIEDMYSIQLKCTTGQHDNRVLKETMRVESEMIVVFESYARAVRMMA